MAKEEKKNDPLYSTFAYDDAFRTMESECDDVVISFVNYLFGENYDSTARISRMRNEHFIDHPGSSEDRRITDSHFTITQDTISKRYHMECESGRYDGSILVRLFEYGTQIALDTGEGDVSEFIVRFPHTGLLLLSAASNAPDQAKITITTPDEDSVSYSIPIIRESDFTIDEIFDKKLYMLIPFYIFNFKKELQDINEDETRLEELKKVYNDIVDRLDKLLEYGQLKEFSRFAIIKITQTVVHKYTESYQCIQKEVVDVMGGKIMDLPEIRIRHEALAEGEAKGEAIGEAKGQAERDRLRSEIEQLKADKERLETEISRLKAEKVSENL